MIDITPLLTDQQLCELAAKLIDTKADAYDVCQQMFGHTFADSDFDRLAERRLINGSPCIFQCEDCKRWQAVSERDRYASFDTCQGCGEEDRENEDEE